jgi:hypothetical protein
VAEGERLVKRVTLNEGAQKAFVSNPHRASAYIGGLGSGKTFAGIARAIQFAQQPKAEGTMWGPRGCVAAINYPVLKDVVLPQFLDMVEGTGLLLEYRRAENKAILRNNAEVLFRSLDRPNWMRGLELSYFFIDEGRHLSTEAWNVLYGRLRQRGYKHAGWVCSTPNGYDWMWSKFHPDSPDQLRDSEWFGAPTRENQHLPEEYIQSLEASYFGRFYEQEVLGHFVGLTEGAVFFEWEPKTALTDVPYRPDLPLYSEWDFGMGDLNVVIFFQVDFVPKVLTDGTKATVPVKRAIGAMEGNNMTSGEWATRFHAYCEQHFGESPVANFGDPAGRQRNQVTGTSVIDDLAAHDILITPAPKKPVDYSVRLLNNMMADGRVLIDRSNCERLGAAISSHKWQLDANGNKTSNTPVHDWTSHYCDAFRYGPTVLFSNFPTRSPQKPKGGYQVDQYGSVFEQVIRNADRERNGRWLGPQPTTDVEWAPGIIRPRS